MISFASLGLSRGLVETVENFGFKHPTPIQENAIPVLLGGNRDFIGLAQTGTGKTAAFGLPLIELVDQHQKAPQALVLAPTRELCLQITKDLERFSGDYKALRIVAVYGGASISEQIRKIKQGAHIVVATPGRLIDLSERGALKLGLIQYLVLDEADEMLNMGFKDDLDRILAFTPDDKQTWLFSATMPKAVRDIAKNYMEDPHELTIGAQNTGNTNIEHQYALVKEKDKYAALKRLLDFNPDIFGLVFCRTKLDTQEVADQLMADGYNADALHGDLTQAQRDRVMAKFRRRDIRILVATDVAARGIDVNDITHVIHLNLPDEMEFYTHRSGRTARAGKTGVSIALMSSREAQRLRLLSKIVGADFEQIQIPKGSDICRRQLLALVDKVKEVEVDNHQMSSFMPEVYEALAGLSKEEIISRFASLEFNTFLEYYRNAPDLNAGDKPAKTSDRREREREREVSADMDRLFINIGRIDGFDKGKLLQVLCDAAKTNKRSIGRIELLDKYSFFEIEKPLSQTIVRALHDASFKGRRLRVNSAAATEQPATKEKKRHDKDKKPSRRKEKAWA